jgi:hypothetical protein
MTGRLTTGKQVSRLLIGALSLAVVLAGTASPVFAAEPAEPAIEAAIVTTEAAPDPEPEATATTKLEPEPTDAPRADPDREATETTRDAKPEPTEAPTSEPQPSEAQPSEPQPSEAPVAEPRVEPEQTEAPPAKPQPTEAEPTEAPSAEPTQAEPTAAPSAEPTQAPKGEPEPTDAPKGHTRLAVSPTAQSASMRVTAPTRTWVERGIYLDTAFSGWNIYGAPIEFLVDGVVVGEGRAWSGGQAWFWWTPEEAGTFTITARAPSWLLETAEPAMVTVLELPKLRVSATPAALQTVGGTATIQATVTNSTGGVIKWQGIQSDYYSTRYDVGQTTIGATGTSTFEVTIEPGGSTFEASFWPVEQSDTQLLYETVTVNARYDTDMSVWVSPSSVTANHTEVEITTDTTTLDGWDCAGGTLTFTDTVAGHSTKLGKADADCGSEFRTRLATPGTHTIDVAYDGGKQHMPARRTITVEVLPDPGLRASGVGRDLATFYPEKDAYIDTLAIRGNRQEPIGVGIKVTNASGRVVRLWTKPVAVGKYSVTWNGRTASGALVAAGRYKIVQTLRDRAGHTRAYTSYTTVSRKRLTWYTKSVTRNGDTYDYYQQTELAAVTRAGSSYARGVQLRANRDYEFAAARWDFTLPAAIRYGTLKFEVLGAAEAGYGAGYLGLASKDEDESGRSLRRSHGWTSLSRPAAGHRFGRRVTGLVWVDGYYLGRHDVEKVRLTYKYAVLK